MEKIITKRESFKNFLKKIECIFEGFNAKESRHHKFQDTHMICICPGGRNGGNSEDVAEVFWGRSMPYKIERHHNDDFTIKTEYLSEVGATLVYSIDERGRVVVLLYPPETKNIKSIDQAYLLDCFNDPKKLHNKKRLKKHWRYFNSLMEVNSLFGKPKLSDKCRVFFIRNFKRKVMNSVVQEHSVFTTWFAKHSNKIIWIAIGSVITLFVTKLIE